MNIQGTLPTEPVPAAPAAAAPSVHIRALITWLAIFPMVAIALTVLGPLMASWHPVLRAFALTVVVVPAAVYLVVPRMLAVYGRLMKARAVKAARGGGRAL